MSASARQRKHELLREAMLFPAFHSHSVLLIFVNLWPISTLCVADMVHAVADIVCGLYLYKIVHVGRMSADKNLVCRHNKRRPTIGQFVGLTCLVSSICRTANRLL